MKGTFSSGRPIRNLLGTRCLDLCEEHNDLDSAARYRVDPDRAVLLVDVLRHPGCTAATWPAGSSNQPRYTLEHASTRKRAEAALRPGAAPICEPRDLLPADASLLPARLRRVVDIGPRGRDRGAIARRASGRRHRPGGR